MSVKMSTENCGGGFDINVPQWKRELILRRRAVGRVLPTESGSVQLTCPSVVAAVRLAEYSVNSDFVRSCESEREQTGTCKNMRLVEQVNASDDFVEPCVLLGIKEIITKIESGASGNLKMGEEKNGKKKYNSSLLCDKKSNELNIISNSNNADDDDGDDCASDSSEELKYGPGIVSKLKSKYLSLTLRESQGKVRPSLDSLRRATSLENILNAPAPEKPKEYKSNYLKNVQSAGTEPVTQRCRGLYRNSKESMKRARSVEVLTRYDKGNLEHSRRGVESNFQDDENDRDERKSLKKRINNLSVEEKELPPPDLVKHTLKIFEKSQNSKSSFNVTKQIPKKTLDTVSAKKPLTVTKGFSSKPNGIHDHSKGFLKQTPTDTGSVTGNDLSNKSQPQCVDRNTVRNLENATENSSDDIPGSDHLGTVDKRKPALCKENSNEPVISKTSISEVQSKPTPQGDSTVEKPVAFSPIAENGLSLDHTDLAVSQSNRQRASPTNATSPKAINDRVVYDSAESKRSISPVLIRAPPSILSSELNSSTSPPQQMKQVGVIRPIVTNKIAQSNLSKQQPNKTHLTEREIEKNLINRVKSIEQPVTKVIVSLKKSAEECFVQQSESVKKGQYWDKKPNTMVFNFSNRKTVPDYIENDGLILASRKEKPKVGESGIILLSGGTEDSSTDYDSEELTTEPSLSCDIIFEGDNILINGRSNIQSKPKVRKMKIQFNDEATTMFEYPSEASLLEDQENVKPDLDESVVNVGSSQRLPVPFRCGNLASYTPSKVSLSTDFQLGVTRNVPPTATKKTDDETNARENGKPGGGGGGGRDDDDDGEEDVDGGCLRPADENDTVTWSSETTADLLF